MADQDRPKIKIDKKEEMRTKGISKMISEGGLGAEKYYKIKKDASASEAESDSIKDKEDE